MTALPSTMTPPAALRGGRGTDYCCGGHMDQLRDLPADLPLNLFSPCPVSPPLTCRRGEDGTGALHGNTKGVGRVVIERQRQSAVCRCWAPIRGRGSRRWLLS